MKIRIPPRLLGGLLARLVRWLGWTLRYEFIDRAGVLKRSPSHPLLWACWHNRIIMVLHAHQRTLRQRHTGVLTSPSGDGAVLAGMLRHFDVDAVRGSSNKRRIASQLEMIDYVNRGNDFCLTPDGPRGPRYRLKPGLLLLAQKTGFPVFPVHVRPARYWQFKTWDGFIVPMPFTRVEVIFDALQFVPETATKEAFEEERLALEHLLREGAPLGDESDVSKSDRAEPGR